jgi:Fe-S cluster assembly protein SufD
MEKWKNFNIKKFSSTNYNVSLKKSRLNLDFFALIQGIESEDTIVFENGLCSYEMQIEEFQNGVIFGSIRSVMKKYPDLVMKYFNKANKQNQNGLNSLNTVFAVDGFFLYVPKNISVKSPFVIVNNFSEASETMINSRSIIVVEENAMVEILQVETSSKTDTQFSNNLTEVFVESNASLNWDRLQKFNGATIAVNPVFIEQKENTQVTTNICTILGNHLRNDIQIKIVGEHSVADVNGVYILNDKNHVDNNVYIDHKVQNCDSNQLFKGVLNGNAKGAFTGYVLVRENSQKTNAYQSNKNILLSDGAKVSTNPFLEIYADDVKCSHGASVGKLDDKALFYLKARGISDKKARELLLSAFAMDALVKVQNLDFKDILTKEIENTFLNY